MLGELLVNISRNMLNVVEGSLIINYTANTGIPPGGRGVMELFVPI